MFLQYSFQLRTTESVNKVFICDTARARDEWIQAINDEVKIPGQNLFFQSYTSDMI